MLDAGKAVNGLFVNPMRSVKQTFLFWETREASVNSMYLNSMGESLDEEERREIIGYLPDLKGKKILDLGSGIGRFTRFFASQAGYLTTVDMASHFVDKNRKDHADFKNVTFLCSDAMELSMEEDSLDFVFLNWLFMYLEDSEIEVLMDRIQRWLKPEGELFFRESCSATRQMSNDPTYYVHYRELSYYDEIVKKRFALLKEGHIQAHVDAFANPLQCFWYCKNPGFV